MQKIIYLKEPGYIQDLYFAFILYYNKEVVTEKFVSKNKATADTKFYKDAVERFEPFDSDLLPFFYLKEDSFCFMAVEFLRNMDFLNNFSFQSILSLLQNKKSVVAKIMFFYFDVKENYESYNLQDIGQLIKDLPYSDALKYQLALFFMNPSYYIDKLINSLVEKEKLLKQYYNEHSDDIFKLQAEIDVDELVKRINQSSTKLNVQSSTTYFSINLISRNRVSYKNSENDLFLFLGSDFKSQLDEYIDCKNPLNLAMMGKIYSENNRIEILRILKSYGELCTSDIAKRMNISPASVYYHLEMMFDAKMLSTRNEGRTIFYSINEDYFIRLKEEFSFFTK